VQIGAFCLRATVSACMFTRWWRLDEEGRRNVWRLYGVFTALMCVGSCAGAAAWAVDMQSSAAALIFAVQLRDYPFPMPNPNYDLPQLISIIAIKYYYAAWHEFLYPIEVLCVSIVKLTVLNRMVDFSVELRDKERWAKAGRVVMVLVVAGGVVGICGNITSAVYKLQTVDLVNSAASAANDDSILDAFKLLYQAENRNELAVKVSSVAKFAEMCTQLLFTAAFVVVGVMCARGVNFYLASTTARVGAKANHLRRQITVYAVFGSLTFLLRAAFELFNAVSAYLQNFGGNCQDPCSTTVSPACPKPYNQFALMQQLLMYAPELQMLVVLISSPLALLVALWGMTSGRTLQAMRHGTKQMETMRDSMLRGEA
jgi:hypothetical protein